MNILYLCRIKWFSGPSRSTSRRWFHWLSSVSSRSWCWSRTGTTWSSWPSSSLVQSWSELIGDLSQHPCPNANVFKLQMYFQDKGVAKWKSPSRLFSPREGGGRRGWPSRRLLEHEVHVGAVCQIQSSQDRAVSTEPPGTLHEDDDVTEIKFTKWKYHLNNSRNRLSRRARFKRVLTFHPSVIINQLSSALDRSFWFNLLFYLLTSITSYLITTRYQL